MRPRRDIDDMDESLFDREEAAERRQQRIDNRARAAKRLEQEAAYDAKLKQAAREFAAATNERAILAEYRVAGVEPRPGTLVSLSMLKKIGWTIATFDGANVLVAPPTPQKWEGPTDADSPERTNPHQRQTSKGIS